MSPDGTAGADLRPILRPDDQSAAVAGGPLDRATQHSGYLDEDAGETAIAPGFFAADGPSVHASPAGPGGMPGPPASTPGYSPAAPGPWRAGLAGYYRKLRAHLALPLFRNAYALMLNTGATGLLGVAYWLLAARHYSAADVGQASAAYAAMNLVSGFTAYNLLGAVNRFVPQAGRRTRALILRAYLFSSVTSVIVSVLFLVNVGHWGASYSELRGMIPSLCFMASVIAWGIFTLQDGVLIGLRSSVWVPVENATFGVVKIILLIAFAAAIPAFGIELSWMLPVIVSLPLVNLLIFAKLVPDHMRLTGDRRPPTRRQIGRFLAGDYTGALCVLAISFLIPVVVAIRVGPNMNAYFYMAWTIGGVLFSVALNMATSLTVEGAFNSETLVANCLAALRRMMRLLVPLALATALLAPVALGLFGRRYATYGAPILELLAIATLPKMLTELYLGALRARSRTRPIAVIQIARAALMLTLALVLTGMIGIVGAGVAVLVSELAVAAVIFIAPGLRHAMLRRRRATVTAESGGYGQLNVRNAGLPAAGGTLKPAASRAGSPEWLPVAVVCAAAAAGLALFLASLGSVTASLGRMNGLGLISVMPASTLAGVALLALAFVVALGLPRPRPVLLGVMLVAIVVCLDGVTAIAEPAPRFPTAYWIAGFVEYVSRTGHTAPGLSAYFSWPGFFEAVAWVEHVVGSRALMPVIRVWPLSVDLLALVPFGIILTRLRANWRAKWFAAFVFAVGNWVGQDYFSPQSFDYLLYLLIIALLLVWFGESRPLKDGPAATTQAGEPPRAGLPGEPTMQFERLPAGLPRAGLPHEATTQFERVPAGPPRAGLPHDPAAHMERVPAKPARWAALLTRPIPGDLPSLSSTRVQRAVLLALIIVIFVFTTESHQLTPFFMIAACAGLVLIRRCRLPGLPVLFGVIFAAWVSFAAVAFWSGHLSTMLGGFGHLGSNVTSSVTDRISSGGTSVHELVLYSRAAFAGTALILAVAGLVRRRRLGFDDRVAFVLMCVPFAAFAMQGYGGEMALRIYLFALPGIAIFVAYFFFPEAAAPRRVRLMLPAAAVCAVAAILVFFVARYGNEAFEQTPPGELSAMNYIYAHDSSGVRLVWASAPPAAGATPDMPWGYRDIDKVTYAPEDAPVNPAQVSGLVAELRAMGPGSYLITTSTQEAFLEQAAGYPADWGQEFRAHMRAFPGVRVAYADSTAVIYTLNWPRGAVARPLPAGYGSPAHPTIWTPIGLAVLAILLALLAGREFARVWYPDPRRMIHRLTLYSLPVLLLFVAVVIIRFVVLS